MSRKTRGPASGPGNRPGPGPASGPRSDIDAVLRSQIEYYRSRAPEYDEWFLRKGRYDRGPEHRNTWFREVEEVRNALRNHGPAGRVVEFAAGTGLWTEVLVERVEHVTALDASPESLALNRERVGSERVTHRVTDLFAWTPPAEPFDGAFFGFWLSHVPPDRFETFWDLVRRSVRPGGGIFFVDSQYDPESTARDHELLAEDADTQTRKLNDGRTFEVVKIFYEPGSLEARLHDLGFPLRVRATPRFFIYGFGFSVG